MTNKSCDYEVIDNALPLCQFLPIQEFLLGPEMPWYFQSCVTSSNESGEGDFYYSHRFYNLTDDAIPSFSNYISVIQPIIAAIPAKRVLIRAKANCYTKTNAVFRHGWHVDQQFPHRGALFYVNTCDGLTVLEDGTEIESVENRLLLFDSSIPHRSTTCTDQIIRVNVNFNYLGQ